MLRELLPKASPARSGPIEAALDAAFKIARADTPDLEDLKSQNIGAFEALQAAEDRLSLAQSEPNSGEPDLPVPAKPKRKSK